MAKGEVPPGIARNLGAARMDLAQGRSLARKAKDAPKPKAEHPTGDMQFLDEDTFNKIVERVEKRAKQPSAPEIHVHISDSKPDSDPPSSEDSALSVHTTLGRLSVRGRVVWLVVVLLALTAGSVLLGRFTAPHGHKAPSTEAPK